LRATQPHSAAPQAVAHYCTLPLGSNGGVLLPPLPPPPARWMRDPPPPPPPLPPPPHPPPTPPHPPPPSPPLAGWRVCLRARSCRVARLPMTRNWFPAEAGALPNPVSRPTPHRTAAPPAPTPVHPAAPPPRRPAAPTAPPPRRPAAPLPPCYPAAPLTLALGTTRPLPSMPPATCRSAATPPCRIRVSYQFLRGLLPKQMRSLTLAL
jgi:hypothetical protein